MSNTLRLRVVPTIGLSPVGSWRGDWTANTDYKYLDFITNSGVNDNVYASTGFFTSSASLADDVTAGNLVLVIDTVGIAADVTAAVTTLTLNKQTGTTYVLQSSDNGKIVTLNNAGAITLTLPNSLPQGFDCIIAQEGAGQVTCTPAGGATLQGSAGATKTLRQYSVANLFVFANAGGAAADWRLGGDITV